MEGVKKITSFVEAVNNAVNNNEEIRGALNECVKKALPNGEADKDKYFQTLKEFENFLPNTIKSFFNEKNLEKLGEDWKNFKISEIKDENDLEKLYAINLTVETRTAIIDKFNMSEVGEKKGLSKEQDIQKAIDTFKKILGESKISATDFYDFINENIVFSEVLSSTDIDDLLKFVDTKKEEKPFTNWCFWNIYNRLKGQPSKDFIDFMVANTDFNGLSYETLNSTIFALMKKHSKYLEGNTKGNMLTALKDILSGNEPYQAFSQALLGVTDIEKKIDLYTIVNNTTDADILEFVRDLVSNDINIKFDNAGEKKQFVVEAKDNVAYSEDALIAFLSKEPDLNQWIKDVFALNQGNVTNNLAKQHSFIKKIDSMEGLLSAKAEAIKSFITGSKDKNRLKKVYGKLLKGKNKKLLSKVKLDKRTVEWSLTSLGNWFKGNEIIKFEEDEEGGSIAQLREFRENWKSNLTDNKEQGSATAYLGYFIWCFSSKLKEDDFNKLLDLGIWNLRENQLYRYELSNTLSKIEDGSISDKFLDTIKSNESVDFLNLYSGDDECFGQCLFNTIYQLIRTSKEYKANDNDAQKRAINDVLKDGENYEWFRNGLKTFFKEANYQKGEKTLSAKDMKVENALEQVEDLKTLLNNCGMELAFNYDEKKPENSNLTVKDRVVVINIVDNEDKKAQLNNLANDKDLLNFITNYEYKNVTTLAGLKKDILKEFIVQEDKKDNYNLLGNEDADLENVQLPANVIDGLLFHLPSHQINIQDEKENNLVNNIITIEDENKEDENKKFEREFDELRKLYGEGNVSSAGALYFMAACSEKSLTIGQQNKILDLHPKNEEGENNEGENIAVGGLSKPEKEPTFSKALAALESIKEDAKITFELIDNFVCDNVDFGQLDSNNGGEINNFYGIIYHLIAHNDNIRKFKDVSNPVSKGIFISSMECVFSHEYQENKEQEAPYSDFWKQIMEFGKDFLALLSSEEIQKNSQKANDGAYVKKLSGLLNDLQVSIKVEQQEISVVPLVAETVKTEEIKIEDENNNTIKNKNKNNKITSTAEIFKHKILGKEIFEQKMNKNNKIKTQNNKTDGSHNQNKKGAKESGFPAWAKILIGFVIAAIAIVLLLFGLGVLGALAGAAKTAMLIIGAVTLLFELICVAALYIFSRSNKLPGGGDGVKLIKINEKTLELENENKNKEQPPEIKTENVQAQNELVDKELTTNQL